MSGALTFLPGAAVNLNFLNLSMSRPDELPIPTTFAAMSSVGTVVFLPDVAAYERGLESHHHVPAHRHDVGRALPFGANQDNRTGL